MLLGKLFANVGLALPDLVTGRAATANASSSPHP
jgi:hypothetical protein